MTESEIDELRLQIKEVTSEILTIVQRRMDLSKKIGEIKHSLNLDIKDEKTEEEVRSYVMNLANQRGMSRDFAGRLINIIINESVRLQEKTIDKNNDNPVTHLSIFLKAKELELQGKKIIHMEVGEPDYPPPLIVKNALADAIDNGYYHYTDVKGIFPLREAISKKIGKNLSPDNVMITSGARFGVFSTMSSILKPGDEIICIDPSWPAYKECAKFCQARIRVLRTTLEDKWNPDVNALESLINCNTKMIILNYPNNPTGKIIDNGILDIILKIVKDNDLFILSDEVYSDFHSGKFKSVVDYKYENSIVVSSFSKSFGMTGFRIGYLISNNRIISQISKIQSLSLTSVAEPIQYSALRILNHDVSRNIKLIQERIKIICEFLESLSLEFYYPDGAMFVFPKLKHGLKDTLFVQELLSSGVAVAPGSGFGSDYSEFIRISACLPSKQLEIGLTTLKNVLEKIQKI